MNSPKPIPFPDDVIDPAVERPHESGWNECCAAWEKWRQEVKGEVYKKVTEIMGVLDS